MSTSSKNDVINEQLIEDIEKDEISFGNEHIEKAKLGNGRALYLIGLEYYHKKRYNKAMKWCELSGSRGEPLASNMIGLMYQSGHGVPINYSLALRHYLKSAQQGLRSSFCNIGELFETAKGVPMNKQMALEWYSKDESFGAKHVKRLNDQGYYLTEWEKEVRSIYALIAEATEILEMEDKRILQRNAEISRQENTDIENQANPVKPSIQNVQKAFILGRKRTTGKVEPLERSRQNLTRSIINGKWTSDTRFNFINPSNDNNKIKELEQENADLKQRMKVLESMIKQFEYNEPYKKLNDDKAKNIA